MKKFDVLAIGNPTIDTTYSVNRIPKQDDKVIGQRLMQQIGGTAANTACVCGSLGLSVAAVAKVGTDSDAAAIVQEYQRHGVDTRFVFEQEGYASSQAIIMLDDSGEKSLIYVPAESENHNDSQLESAIILSRYVYLMPGDIDLFERVGEIAKKSLTKVVVDIEPTIVSCKQDLERILAYTDLAYFNHDGFVNAVGLAPSEAAIRSLVEQFSLQGLVVTMGSHGVMAYVENEFVQVGGFSVPVVDTTGAGDTFNATFLYSQIMKMKLEQGLTYACAAAAISLSALGAKGAVPTVQTIEAFLSKHPV
jgi:ribokinase/sulfofructose kinase